MISQQSLVNKQPQKARRWVLNCLNLRLFLDCHELQKSIEEGVVCWEESKVIVHLGKDAKYATIFKAFHHIIQDPKVWNNDILDLQKWASTIEKSEYITYYSKKTLPFFAETMKEKLLKSSLRPNWTFISSPTEVMTSSTNANYLDDEALFEGFEGLNDIIFDFNCSPTNQLEENGTFMMNSIAFMSPINEDEEQKGSKSVQVEGSNSLSELSDYNHSAAFPIMKQPSVYNMQEEKTLFKAIINSPAQENVRHCVPSMEAGVLSVGGDIIPESPNIFACFATNWNFSRKTSFVNSEDGSINLEYVNSMHLSLHVFRIPALLNY